MDNIRTLSGLVTVVADTVPVSPPEVTRRPRNIFEQFLRKPQDLSITQVLQEGLVGIGPILMISMLLVQPQSSDGYRVLEHAQFSSILATTS